MKKRLFLTGPSNCGKSAMIGAILGQAMLSAGGFVCENRYDSLGNIQSSSFLPAAAAGGIQGFDVYPYLDFIPCPPKADNEVIRVEGTRLLREAAYYPFVVLDGIGGIDMLIPQYRFALEELLNSDIPCIGVIKGRDELEFLRNSFSLTERFTMLTDNLRTALENDSETVLIPTMGRGDIKALRLIKQWAEEYT